MKDEVFSSGYMNIRQTDKVKKIISDTDQFHEYGIKQGEGIQPEQLLSVILYCDTNDLQSDFSSTFRRKNQYENIEQLKKRHSKYFHFAKGMVEAVMIFGVDNYLNQREKGPFYCGLNRVLAISDFDAHFIAPTSTSADIEVAISFAERWHDFRDWQ